MKNNSFHFLSSLIFKGTVSLWEFFYNLNFLFHLIRLSRVKVSIAQSSVQQRSGLVEENQLEWHLVWFQESCKHLYLYMYACVTCSQILSSETLICFEQNSLNPQPKLLTAGGLWWWLLSSSTFLPLCCFLGDLWYMVAGGSQGHWIYFCDVICSKKRTLNYIVFVCEFTVSDIYTLLPHMSFQSIFTSEP